MKRIPCLTQKTNIFGCHCSRGWCGEQWIPEVPVSRKHYLNKQVEDPSQSPLIYCLPLVYVGQGKCTKPFSIFNMNILNPKLVGLALQDKQSQVLTHSQSELMTCSVIQQIDLVNNYFVTLLRGPQWTKWLKLLGVIRYGITRESWYKQEKN